MASKYYDKSGGKFTISTGKIKKKLPNGLQNQLLLKWKKTGGFAPLLPSQLLLYVSASDRT